MNSYYKNATLLSVNNDFSISSYDDMTRILPKNSIIFIINIVNDGNYLKAICLCKYGLCSFWWIKNSTFGKNPELYFTKI